LQELPSGTIDIELMASSESQRIRRTIVRDCVPDGISIQEERGQWAAYAESLELAEGILLRPETISDVPCLWVEHESSQNQSMVMYVHGGGLIAGSSVTHREFASRLVKRIRRRVLLVDYRLAPEHSFPAALDDLVAVYADLIARMQAKDITFGGDSTGAGLALAALTKLRDDGRALPAGAFFISGHFDMTLSGDSMDSRREVDPFTSRESLERAIRWYTNGADCKLPLVSPVFADLSMLPPILVQVGDDEILLSDSVRVAERIRKSGGRAELRVWTAMWHTWPMYVGLPEADGALKEVGEFLERFASRP
jgi:epsilon-lactone hydrolase